jgi:hypothetical protein
MKMKAKQAMAIAIAARSNISDRPSDPTPRIRRSAVRSRLILQRCSDRREGWS